MKNIKVYDYFLKYNDNSFRIKFFKISLARTFIFNLNNNDIYYRKANVLRKISLIGRERAFLISNKSCFKSFEYDKYMMIPIDSLIKEYVSYDNYFSISKETCIDIVEKKKKRIITSDSILRRVSKDELVTMCFDDNQLLFNTLSNNNYYENVSI
ncbi:MAG: hypothetical protein IJN90_00690 [Bacilli bacterium]|nr:hypothetical protein [Bacilli bacterium]